jgi:RHS repeat-associated protein
MPTLTLSYDEENRLLQSVQSVNGSEQYVYNPSGQLVYRQNNATTEVYMYGVQGERVRFGLVQPSWYDLNQLLLLWEDQDVYFAGKLLEVNDLLGTTAGTTFPYGELREAPGPGANDRYATYLLDTTSNLNYARNRWYSSQVARFTIPDPWGGSASATVPQSWNRYAYAAGDPINKNDPSGLTPIFETGLSQTCLIWSANEGCPSPGGALGDGTFLNGFQGSSDTWGQGTTIATELDYNNFQSVSQTCPAGQVSQPNGTCQFPYVPPAGSTPSVTSTITFQQSSPADPAPTDPTTAPATQNIFGLSCGGSLVTLGVGVLTTGATAAALIYLPEAEPEIYEGLEGLLTIQHLSVPAAAPVTVLVLGAEASWQNCHR